MKKLFYKILLAFSVWLIHKAFSLNTKCENKLAEIEKKKRNSIINIKNAIAFLVACSFVVAFLLSRPTPNIQDVKVEKPKKVIVVIDRDFLFAKKSFKFLDGNKDVWEFTKNEAENEDVDPMLVFSIMQHETGGYCGNNWKCMQKAVSRAGARGPMQIMPFHAPNPDDLFNWKYNIKKGIWYIKACMEASGGNIIDTARRYNQGIYGNPKKYRNWKYAYRIRNKYRSVLTEKVMVAGI
jgi:hypothetical protein